MNEEKFKKAAEEEAGCVISVGGMVVRTLSLTQMKKTRKHYDEGNMTSVECGIRMMRVLTADTVTHFLSLATPEMVLRLKTDAFCGKRLMVGWIGMREEERLKTEEEFNRGLSILRQHFQGEDMGDANLKAAIAQHREDLKRHYGQLTLTDVREVRKGMWEAKDGHGRSVRIGYGLTTSPLADLGNRNKIGLAMHVQAADGQWWDTPPIPIDGPGEPEGGINTTEQLMKFLKDNIIPSKA